MQRRKRDKERKKIKEEGRNYSCKLVIDYVISVL